MNGRDLLAMWKAEALADARRRAKRLRDAFNALRGKDTPYAVAIRTLAEIHERALAVYEVDCGEATDAKAVADCLFRAQLEWQEAAKRGEATDTVYGYQAQAVVELLTRRQA